MKKSLIEILTKFSLVIFSFLLLYYAFQGIRTTVWESDSLAYHIPISELILNGQVINPGKLNYSPPVDKERLYQPGSSEIILSVLSFFKIPLNLFDVFGIVFLFAVMYVLGKSYNLYTNLSLLFASSIATLHTVMRWALSQTIDVWLASFFGLSLVLLRKPQKSYRYFLILGIALGMLFGSKYTGPAYFAFLLIIFGKKLLSHLNLRRLIMFLVPFSLLGLSWYIRNYILTGDPFFPQTVLFFKGIEYHVLDNAVWKMFLYFKNGPIIWLNSFISEYTVWSLSPLLIPAIILWKDKETNKLLILSLLCFVVYLFLPSGPSASLITSVFRYTYPVMFPLILSVFLYVKKTKREEVLSIICLTNMLIIPELSYHPKILIVLIPLALFIFECSKIKSFNKFIKKAQPH